MKVVDLGAFEIELMGRLLRTAQIRREWDVDVDDPEAIVKSIRAGGIRADLFTFMQRLPHSEPRFPYRMELDNIAAIPISTYDEWWTNQVNRRVRLKVKKSIREGIRVVKIEFTDDFVRGIMDIYNESPVRQGRTFRHYGKSFKETKEANGTYLDRADIFGAFHGEELAGFLKIVYSKGFARTMGIMGKIAHRDKAPMNALIAKAVEACVQRGVPYLTYGRYLYGAKGSDSLADFKRYNGFLKYDLPRYYIPLSTRGRIALALNLHKGLKAVLPRWLITPLLKLRKGAVERLRGEQVESGQDPR